MFDQELDKKKANIVKEDVLEEIGKIVNKYSKGSEVPGWVLFGIDVACIEILSSIGAALKDEGNVDISTITEGWSRAIQTRIKEKSGGSDA